MGNNNYPRDPRNIPGNKRPQRRRRKPEVPPAVIVIYVVMAVLILAICAVVFAITLKKTNNQSDPDSSDPSVVSSAESSGQSSSTQSSQSSSESSGESSGESTSSDTSSEPASSSSTKSSSSSKASSSDTTPVDNPTVLSTTYSKEFFDKDLFIGDSIFTGLSGYGYIDAERVAAKIGYTPSGAMNKEFDTRGISAVEYAKQLQPKRIYIMLGSNTMGAGTDYDIIVSQYRDLVKKLRSECPKSLICVVSIPPVTKDSSAAKTGNITNENILKVNEKLKAMAKECEEEYFDLNSLLSDSNGYFNEDYAEQDGLHFLGKTYKVLLSALEKEMTP